MEALHCAYARYMTPCSSCDDTVRRVIYRCPLIPVTSGEASVSLAFYLGGAVFLYQCTHQSRHCRKSFKMPSALGIIDHSPHQPEPSPPIPTASNLVLIDNYDSFTWNVYQYLVLEGATVHVFRNDQISLEELIQKNPTQLIISPGPGHPATDSGISRDAIRHFAGKVPIFGVCMGL